MRLAWWRDELAKPREHRPPGDAVLDAIGMHWSGAEAALSQLVDGWEVMLGEPPLTRDAAKSFANGRAAPFAFGAGAYRSDDWQRVHAAASRWALADAAANISDDKERQTFAELGMGWISNVGTIPRHLRGLAILEGLAVRSLKSSGAPLMAGRGAALLSLRLGIFGR